MSRIDDAAKAICAGSARATYPNMDAIAVQCGYDSPETFRAAFKRLTRVSPGKYRREYAGAA